MKSDSINYHFMIDDKFIDGFIKDSEKSNSNNKYIVTTDGELYHVKSRLILQASYYSEKLNEII